MAGRQQGIPTIMSCVRNGGRFIFSLQSLSNRAGDCPRGLNIPMDLASGPIKLRFVRNVKMLSRFLTWLNLHRDTPGSLTRMSLGPDENVGNALMVSY